VKDLLAGGIFVALGLFYGIYAYVDLPIGTAFRMGPGFFPIMLAGLLVLIGLVVVLQALSAASSPMTAIAWRGLVFILAAPIAFGLFLRGFTLWGTDIHIPGLGFIPAIVLVCGISAFASRRMSLLKAVVITVGMTAFCVAVFYFGLGLPVRLFGGLFD
jgi:hypothetical protein